LWPGKIRFTWKVAPGVENHGHAELGAEMRSAEHLRRKHPYSALVVRDLQSGEVTVEST
jgi:hypothetical protein